VPKSRAGKLGKVSGIRAQDENSDKGGLVQFRVESGFLAQLSAVASRMQLPVGVLARLWVAERLAQELAFDNVSIEKWLAERYAEISEKISQFDPGPVQIMHMIPQNLELNIEPELMPKIHNQLPPIERIAEYSGRINRLGYQTIKIYRDTDKMNGYVQAFRTGQLESVRVLHVSEQLEALYGDQLDDDLIRAVWSYGGALYNLGVALPLKIFLRFSGLNGLTLRSRHHHGSVTLFDEDSFNLPVIEITDWSMLKNLESTAVALQQALDILWNAAGFSRSPSYSNNDTWRGSLDDRMYSQMENKSLPAAPSKAEVRINVTDSEGQPLQNAHVVLVAQNKTIVGDKTNATGQVILSPPKKGLATVFCAHPHALPYMKTSFDKLHPVHIQLETSSNGGSIICDGTGYIPEFEGRLNPIRDTSDRLYLYADNIAIEGGGQQPYSFKLGQELSLEDAQGVMMKIKIHDVIGKTSLIEYHRVDPS
jgi:hypothetical protein